METLEAMPNIGKTVGQQLRRAGVETPEQLREIGSREAWLRIQGFDPSACYNRLCALEGAVQGIRWHGLSEEDKKALKEFYREHQL
ncbi:TfoX/Sxy family protein [Caproicibacter sp.]|uniref:TfoX/Sxy family protein n=1 Tax=Caproicibacter sp. TaxID=2814884 RepID=UPI003989FD86